MLGRGLHPDFARNREPAEGRGRCKSEERKQRERERKRETRTHTNTHTHSHRHSVRRTEKDILREMHTKEKLEVGWRRERRLGVREKDRNRDGLLERQSHEGD